MSFEPWTIALEVVNFLVLVWLLERLLYRPVLAVIAGREAEVERLHRADEAAHAAITSERETLARERDAIAAERARLLEDAHTKALDERRKLAAQAHAETERLLADGRARLAHERDEAAAELRRKSLDLAVAIARGLLAASTPADGDGHFVDAVCAHLRAMDEEERARLAASLDGTQTVQVLTVEPLTPERERRCRERIAAALGHDVTMRFGVDASLIAGIEVYFPGLVLRHSWRDALASLQAELMAEAEDGTDTVRRERRGDDSHPR